MRRLVGMKHKKAPSPGFTIVELLIVVVVIAILAAIVIVSYNGIKQRADASARKTELSQLSRKIQTDILQSTGNTVDIKTPIGFAEASGTTVLDTPLESAQELTLYGVFDTTNSPATVSWSSMIELSPNNSSNNSIKLRTGAASSDTARAYYSTSSQTNRDLTKNNIMNTASRHIGWVTTNGAMIYASYDTQSDASASLTAHTGFNFSSVTMYSATAYTPVAALVFAQYHDATTRQQIVQWLNQQYTVGL